jgi:hypothetical protein
MKCQNPNDKQKIAKSACGWGRTATNRVDDIRDVNRGPPPGGLTKCRSITGGDLPMKTIEQTMRTPADRPQPPIIFCLSQAPGAWPRRPAPGGDLSPADLDRSSRPVGWASFQVPFQKPIGRFPCRGGEVVPAFGIYRLEIFRLAVELVDRQRGLNARSNAGNLEIAVSHWGNR